MGKGVINILTKNGGKRYIPDVYFVPGLKHNLMSVGQLVQKGYKVSFDNDVCTILDRNPSGRLIARVNMTQNRMFPLQIHCIQGGKEVSFKAVYLYQSWLWHLRYGHLHFDALSLLQNKYMVKELPQILKPRNSCEICILEKQHRESFPVGGSYREREPLELVHTDICGPMQTPSLGGSIYFPTFIDDFSRKTWIYFQHTIKI